MSEGEEDVLGLDTLSSAHEEGTAIETAFIQRGEMEDGEGTDPESEEETQEPIDDCLKVTEAEPTIIIEEELPRKKKRKKNKTKINDPPKDYNKDREELILLIDKLQARVDILETKKKSKQAKSNEWKKLKSEQMRHYHQQKKDAERIKSVHLTPDKQTVQRELFSNSKMMEQPPISSSFNRPIFSGTHVTNGVPYRGMAWNF